MKNKISRILKQSRRENGFSAEYVVNELKRYGITISAKTIYGYETTQNQPNADMFVALCKIYGIKTLDIFFDDDTSEVVNPTITKYNTLNSSGKKKADEYITDLSEQKKYTTADEENSNNFLFSPRKIAAYGADGTKQINPPNNSRKIT